jgi:signal transduction histidine kinase
MESIGKLAAGIAHDFNNQLAVIRGYAEMLTMSLVDSDISEYPKKILSASDRSADLISKLLAFSRNQPHTTDVVDVHDLISDVTTILAHTTKSFVAGTDLSAVNSKVVGDSTMLQNMLLNLGVNARDAGAKTVTISTYNNSS